MNSVFSNFSIDDCYEILKKNVNASNCTVQSYEFCPLKEKMGFLGDHSVLKIFYNDNNHPKITQFFVKAMSSTESQRTFATVTGAFLKECYMFQKLVPEFLKNDVLIIQDCLPTCYLVFDMNYLIFEDLSSKSYRTVSQRECMPLECVRLFLDVLAKYHCTALIFEEKMKLKIGNSFILTENFPILLTETFYNNLKPSVRLVEATKKGVQAEIDLFENELDLNIVLFKELACKTFDQFPEIVKPSNVFRNTICHGDLWASNIMFKFEGDKPVHCSIVDFQSYRYGPPAQDFLSFMYLSTDRPFRQQYLAEMTTYYYQRMSKILMDHNLSIKKLLPYKEFIESCDYYKLFSIAQAINHFQLIITPSDIVKNLFDVPGALEEVLFEDKSTFVLEVCKKDEIYRRRMLESIIDLRDVFIERGLLELYM